MVDLSKHLAHARQAMDRRGWDIAISTMLQCQEVAPDNLEVYKLMIEAAKRKAKEAGKKGFLSGMGMPTLSKDPQKQLSAAVEKMTKAPDAKSFAAAGDAAYKAFQGGMKPLREVGVLLYEEVRATGMFNGDALWNLAHLYYERFRETKEAEALEKALKTLGELEKAMPNHPEAGRTLKNWEAMRSMAKRNQAGGPGTADFRAQLSSDEKARRQEAMNRMIRTAEDAKEVIGFIDQDLAVTPNDKSLWSKKADIYKRMSQFAEARAAYEKAQEIDPHDFQVTMRLGDVRIEELEQQIAQLDQGSATAATAQQELIKLRIDEYRKRVERQPTDMNHRFNLATQLLKAGEIDAAAAEFQRTQNDPRLRRSSHRYLGYCLAKKGLNDLAIKQYSSYLDITEDDSTDEAKGVRYARAGLLTLLGRKDQARADYSRLVEVDLGYKDAAKRLDEMTAEG